MMEKYQWIAAAAAFANPVSSLDLLATAAINAQMGNISYKLGRKLYWDKEKGSFRKDKRANKLMKAKYHNGWKLPTV